QSTAASRATAWRSLPTRRSSRRSPGRPAWSLPHAYCSGTCARSPPRSPAPFLLFERRDRLLHRARRIEWGGRHHIVHTVVEVLDAELRLSERTIRVL